jgi:hypothetical protein
MDEAVMGCLVFENIEFEVGRGSHSKKILHKISGQKSNQDTHWPWWALPELGKNLLSFHCNVL